MRHFDHSNVGDDNHMSTHDVKMLKKELVILDWQICDVGSPVKDIAQLISMSGLDQYHKRTLEKIPHLRPPMVTTLDNYRRQYASKVDVD